MVYVLNYFVRSTSPTVSESVFENAIKTLIILPPDYRSMAAKEDDTVTQMLQNHKKDSFDTTEEAVATETTAQRIFDNDDAGPLTRFKAYVDHCFETYDVVSDNLDREQIQCCIADWGRRRGQCKYNAKMGKQKFGKRVSDSAHKTYTRGNHAIFVATPLVGIKPDEDKGKGWKATVRHELGHAIDYEIRGQSDHGPKFKRVMAKFGHEVNKGQCSGGYPPRIFR